MKEAHANLENEVKGCSLLIIWTDCDREGENIGHEISMICQKKNPKIRILRARFSAIIPRYVKLCCSMGANCGEVEVVRFEFSKSFYLPMLIILV